MKTLGTGIVLAMAATAIPAAAQNLVTNGGFESQLSNWVNNPSANRAWSTTDDNAITGVFSATTGCVGPQCTRDSQNNLDTANGNYLYQDIATTANASYTLSFDFRSGGGPSELAVLFGGTVVYDSTTLPTLNTPFTFSSLTATGSTTRLLFLSREDPGYNRLDNVSLVANGAGPVPEPATWAMMLAGFAAVGAAIRRRRTSVAYA